MLLEALPDLLFRISDDYRYLGFKPAKDFEPYVPPDEFLGKRIDEVLPPAVARLAIRSVDQALASGETQTFEYELPTGNEMHSFEARIVRLAANEALAIIRDITITWNPTVVGSGDPLMQQGDKVILVGKTNTIRFSLRLRGRP